MKNQNRLWIYPLFIMCALLIATSSCTKSSSTTPTTTTNTNTITDVDGNLYHYVVIGTQTWLVENLKTTHFNDGTPIPNVTNAADRHTLKTPAYFWYNNDINNKDTYGALYDWYAVNTGILAPKGWHVPSNDEWKILINFLGGANVAGKHLKEKGATHWDSTNNSDNSSGFTALPGGCTNLDGFFEYIGMFGNWWSSTPYASGAMCQSMSPGSNGVAETTENPKNFGYSVRCVKN